MFFFFFKQNVFFFLQPFPHCMYKIIHLLIIIDSLCSHPKGKLFLSHFEGSGLYGIMAYYRLEFWVSAQATSVSVKSVHML